MGNEIDQVHPQLAIASIQGAREEPLGSFDVIVTVCQDSIEDHVPSGVEYEFYNMADGVADGYGGRSDYPFFKRAASSVLAHLKRGQNVLVHCHAGQSRSASVSIAALARYQGTTYQEMERQVDEQRPQICPDSILQAHAMEFAGDELQGIAKRMREKARERRL